MNDDSKLVINVPAEYSGTPINVHVTSENIERTGEAEEIRQPHHFHANVLIMGINEWIGKRAFAEDITQNKAVILFSTDVKDPYIRFLQDPNDKHNNSIETHLKLNPDLLVWGINEDKFFQQEQLKKYIRKYSHCFATIEDAKALIDKLTSFQVKYETEIKKEDDRRGNTENAITNALKFTKGELPTSIHLKMPLYVGTPAVDIHLDIEVEKQGNGHPGFGFYSLDLEVRKREVAEELIWAEINQLNDKFVTLEQ